MSRQDSVFSQCSEAESYAGYSEDETMIAGDMDGEWLWSLPVGSVTSPVTHFTRRTVPSFAVARGPTRTAAIGEEEDEAAEVLTPSDLLERQIRGIEEVNSVFQIPAGTARILLAHFKWDKERLFER